MNNVVVRTSNLGKRYLIGGQRESYQTLRSALTRAVMRPIERIRHPGAATHQSRELWALRNVDLEVGQGEVLGIIGHNGSGKSTLLKILSHITEPTEGRAEIRGRVASLLEVGTGFHGELTGRENILLNGAILGMRRAEIKRKFDEIVAFAGVEGFLDTPVKRYSSGMYVRLAFAVAAHLEPEILVIDEVLAVGDAEFQRKCLGRMHDVAKGGRTVLFVSHNMVAVEGLCTSAILLNSGKVVKRGEVDSVVASHLRTNRDPVEPGTALARSKDGKVELEAVRLTDTAGEPLAVAQCGGTIRLELAVHSSDEFRTAVASIDVNDSYGRKVAVLHSYICGFSCPLSPGRQVLACEIEKLPLSPGSYTLDVKLYREGARAAEDLLIWAPSCRSMEVAGGDFYGTGRLPPPAWGTVVQIAQTWSCDRVPD